MQLVPKEERLKPMAKGRELLYVSDWNWAGNLISILVNKSDKGISDPVFTVPQAQKRRTAVKQENEGQDFSVHILIQLPDDEIESALVIVEYCSGLGIFVVQRLLNQILDDAKKISPVDFVQLHLDGSVDANGDAKKCNVVYRCDFKGHISDELEYDLDNGKIQSIELITEKEKSQNFDEDGYIVEKCKTLVLTLKDEENPLTDKFSRIVKVFNKQKEDYSKARIKFKSPTGIDRTVEMDTAQGLVEAYVKRDKLEGFESDLLASYENFDDKIIEKMKGLLGPA